jgi:O-antigen ligase
VLSTSDSTRVASTAEPASARDAPRAPERRAPDAGGATAVLVAGACAVVPGVYASGWSDVFAAPKLGALWAVLVVGLLLVAAGVLFGHLTPSMLSAPRVVVGALGAWLVFNLAAFLTSTDRHQSLFGEHFWYQGVLTVLLYAAFLVIARIVFTTPFRAWLLAAGIAAGGLYVASVGLLQQAGADPVFGISPPGGRVFSTIGQPNALAAYLVVTIAVTAAFLARPEPVLRVIALAALVVMVACLVLTDSRGGWAGLLAAAIVALLGSVFVLRIRLLGVVATLAALGCVVTVAYFTVTPLRTRLDREYERALSSTNASGDVSNAYHLDLWHVAWHVTVDHPLLGTGQETFPEVFPSYSMELPFFHAVVLDEYRIESPHDVYLAISAGTGVPALAAYVLLVASVVIAMLLAARRATTASTKALLVMLVAAIGGHLASDAFMTADLTTAWLLWLLMGAGLGVASTVGARPAA